MITNVNRRRRGVLVVWLAMCLLVLLLFIGLALDTANIVLAKEQLQNAADASALAGAQQVIGTDGNATEQAAVKAQTEAVARANRVAGTGVVVADADVTLGRYYRPGESGTYLGFYASGATGGSPVDAVRVTPKRLAGGNGGIPLIFGPMVGVQSSGIQTQAIAVNRTVAGAGIILLNPHAAPSLQMTGSGSTSKVNVVNGAVQINSDSSGSVGWSGNPLVVTPNLYLSGSEPSVGSVLQGKLHQQSPPAVDPLLGTPAPTKSGLPTRSAGNSMLPGYYPNGITQGGTMAAGVYYVENGISLKGNDVLDASAGCLIYLATGAITLKGGSQIKIDPMTTGTYANISIWQPYGNTNDLTLKGTTDIINSGTLYVPAAHVQIQGTPTALGSQLIADTLDVQGNGSLTITYTGNFKTIRKVYLVQ